MRAGCGLRAGRHRTERKVMDTKYIYRCEDSEIGIFTAVYDAWASVHSHEENRIEVKGTEGDNLLLFAEYTDVCPMEDKAEKVRRSIRTRISEEGYEMVMKAVFSSDSEKGEVIYRFLISAFKEGGNAVRSYGNPWTMRLFEIVRNYDNEVHHLKGFLRFDRIYNGIYFATFSPQNNVLGELMVHFSDRLNPENFVILDEKRGLAGVHAAGKDWFLYRPTRVEIKRLLTNASGDDRYAGLWRIFHKCIAIESRKNPTLQRNNLPLRFRPFMTEFRKDAKAEIFSEKT